MANRTLSTKSNTKTKSRKIPLQKESRSSPDVPAFLDSNIPDIDNPQDSISTEPKDYIFPFQNHFVFRIIKFVFFIFPWFGLLYLYVINASQRVTGYADVEELVMTASYNGLSHPPGHKLYTILMSWWLNIMPGDNLIREASWLSGVLHVISLYIVYRAILLITDKNKFVIQWLVLLWGLSSAWWFNAIVPTTWSMDTFFSSIILYTSLLMYVKKSTRLNYLLWFLFGISMAHNLVLIVWTPLIIYVNYKQTFQANQSIKFKSFLSLLMGYGTFLLVLLPVNENSPSSWNIPKSLSEALAYTSWPLWARNSGQLPNTLIEITKWLVDQTKTLGLFVALIGAIQLLRTKVSLSLMLLIVWILGIYGVAGYLLVPDQSFGEASYYWGIFQITQLTSAGWVVMVFASGFILEKFPIKTNFLQLLIVIGLCLIGWKQLTDIQISMNVKDTNVMDVFTNRVLEDLPEYAVFIVGDDLYGSIMYQQLINQIRPDVTIIPSTWQRRFQWAQSNLDYLGWEFQNQEQQIANTIAWNLYRERRVFVFGLDSNTLERVGIDGNPFYGAPYSYSIEITTEPQLPPEGEYSITEPISRIPKTNNLSNYDRGLIGFFSMQHTIYGYIYWRLGFHEPADIHWYLAYNLAQFPENQQMIANLNKQTLMPALFTSESQPAIWWMEQAIASTENQNWQDAYFQSERATLLAPTDLKARELMWEVSRKIGLSDSDTHYKILKLYEQNQIDQEVGL